MALHFVWLVGLVLLGKANEKKKNGKEILYIVCGTTQRIHTKHGGAQVCQSMHKFYVQFILLPVCAGWPVPHLFRHFVARCNNICEALVTIIG